MLGSAGGSNRAHAPKLHYLHERARRLSSLSSGSGLGRKYDPSLGRRCGPKRANPQVERGDSSPRGDGGPGLSSPVTAGEDGHEFELDVAVGVDGYDPSDPRVGLVVTDDEAATDDL